MILTFLILIVSGFRGFLPSTFLSFCISVDGIPPLVPSSPLVPKKGEQSPFQFKNFQKKILEKLHSDIDL
jgi:hypothetical protein